MFRKGQTMNSVSLDLTRCRNRKVAGHTGCKIVGILRKLGVPKQMLYVRRPRPNGSFWLRQINHLQVLEQARQLYRRRIVEVHPDKAGGCLEQAIQLNDSWSKIQQRFKQHGHELW
jgi:hypothetical protein